MIIADAVAGASQAKVTVLLAPAEFSRFEAYCTARGFKKSTLIARLIREHLDSEGFQVQRTLPLNAGERPGK